MNDSFLLISSSVPLALLFYVTLFIETLCMSAPRMHQTLHRPQLVAQTRQGPLHQIPAGTGQGNSFKCLFLYRDTLVTSSPSLHNVIT